MISKTIFIIAFLLGGLSIQAQSHDAQVLLLDYEKYIEIKKTYKEIKKTYDVLREGYDKISGVASGDLAIHKVFLEGLKEVSPVVANYHKVVGIIKKQQWIIKQYGPLMAYVNNVQNFSQDEVKYIKNITDNLMEASADNLDNLLRIITATELNMSDDQRIKLIDKLDDRLHGQVTLVIKLQQRVGVMAKYREQTTKDFDIFKSINKYSNGTP